MIKYISFELTIAVNKSQMVLSLHLFGGVPPLKSSHASTKLKMKKYGYRPVKEGGVMHLKRNILELETTTRDALYDITEQVRSKVEQSGIKNGLVSIYAHGATAAIMIQEGWDDSVQNDVVTLLRKLAPHGVWEHDRQDGNADAHLKAGLVGPGETVPLIDGKLGLSTWQNIFFCEFDGPRKMRRIVVTVIGA